MDRFRQEIEVTGHLIDSMILTRIFELVIDMDGEFEVLEINVGKKKEEHSFAKLIIEGKTKGHLDEILEMAYRAGATVHVPPEVRLEAAPNDSVMPDDFYSTTNNRTHVFHRNRWVGVENMMMDKCIVVDNGRASCVPIRDIRKGDRIVIGEDGIKITPPERPRGSDNIFEFMGSSSSSERPTQHIARRVAEDIVRTRADGGKIILVGGPAIVHTGAADAVAELVRDGYINGILAGNALAVHDIEYATLGTSLGMNIRNGTLAVHGHKNHMIAVNSVFKARSIADMVRAGKPQERNNVRVRQGRCSVRACRIHKRRRPAARRDYRRSRGPAQVQKDTEGCKDGHNGIDNAPLHCHRQHAACRRQGNSGGHQSAHGYQAYGSRKRGRLLASSPM